LNFEYLASGINDEAGGDEAEDDDDEYFDPERYEEEELRAEGVLSR